MFGRVSRSPRWLASVCIVGSLCACGKDRPAQTQPATTPTDGAPAAPTPSPADLAPLKPALEAAPTTTVTFPPTIGFDWGPPCRVPAIQEVEKDGRRARFGFDVVLERSNNRLVARLDNMRVIPMPGESQQQRAGIEGAIAALEGSIPPIAVADSGESQGALDIDKALDATLAFVATVVKDDKANAMMANLLRSPQWKGAFAQKAGESWDAWVGRWTGMTVKPNTERRDKIDLPSAVGTFKDVAIVVTHHGSVRAAPALALVSVEQTIEGPQLAAVMGGLVKDLAAGAGSDVSGLKIGHARKSDRSTAAIDPVLGRPHRARHETTIELDDKRRQQSRDTVFDWSRATGCVATSNAKPAAGSAR